MQPPRKTWPEIWPPPGPATRMVPVHEGRLLKHDYLSFVCDRCGVTGVDVRGVSVACIHVTCVRAVGLTGIHVTGLTVVDVIGINVTGVSVRGLV